MGYNHFNDIKYRRKSEKGEKRNFTDETRTLSTNKKRESISLLQYECCSDRNVVTNSNNIPDHPRDAIGSDYSSSGSNNEFLYEDIR